MSETGTPEDVSSTHGSSSRKSIAHLRSTIADKIATNDKISERFGADPTTRPIRDKRHQATTELKLEKLVAIDPLTGLLNKQPYAAERDRILGVIDRDPATPPADGILLDIDNFGIFNKSYGNPMGDKILSMVGRTIGTTIRSTDVPGRIGGEEFEILAQRTTIPERTTDPNSVMLAEKIRRAIENAQLETGQRVTVSVGTTQYVRGENRKKYLDRLNAAQIVAKRLGKNRVVESFIDQNGQDRARDLSNGKIYSYTKDEEGKLTRIDEVTG